MFKKFIKISANKSVLQSAFFDIMRDKMVNNHAHTRTHIEIPNTRDNEDVIVCIRDENMNHVRSSLSVQREKSVFPLSALVLG